MRDARAAVAAGVVLIALAVALVVSGSPLTLAGGSSLRGREAFAYTNGDASACQDAETIPQGTSAVRLALASNLGPRLRVEVLSGSRVITRGERGAGWGQGETVTVPVARVAQTVRDARICTTVGPSFEPLRVDGPRTASSSPAQHLAGHVLLRIEYLRPGPKSWLALAPSIARHLSLGRGAPGLWIVFLLLALVVAMVALATRLALRELR